MTGTRGPLPKPTALKLIAGNPGKRSLNLADGVNPRVEIPTPPKHLSPTARKEWRRITPILEELGLISGLDVAALTLYCESYARLVDLQMAFNAKVSTRVHGGEDHADAVLAVSTGTTPSGYQQQSVLVQLINSHRDQVHRFLMHFGLSPAARARVTPSNFVQPELPGITPAATPAGFQKFANSN